MDVQPHPEWRLIVAMLSSRAYGDVVSHRDLVELTGLVYPSARYFRQVKIARRELLADWSRELETVYREGYRLVEPKEFHRRHRREVGFAGRRLRRACAILVAAPQHLLSDDDNARNADALAKVGALETQRRRAMTETRPSLSAPKVDTPKMLS